MSQLTDGTFFNLPYSLTGNLEFLTDFFEGVVMVVYQTKPQLDDLSLT